MGGRPSHSQMMRFYPRVGHCWEGEERECEYNQASDGFAVDEADHALHGCHGDNASTGGARHARRKRGIRRYSLRVGSPRSARP